MNSKQNNTLSRETEGLGPMKFQQPHLYVTVLNPAEHSSER